MISGCSRTPLSNTCKADDRTIVERVQTFTAAAGVCRPYIRPFAADGRWRSAKRPGVDRFLREMATLYEIAIFTDGSIAVDQVRSKRLYL